MLLNFVAVVAPYWRGMSTCAGPLPISCNGVQSDGKKILVFLIVFILMDRHCSSIYCDAHVTCRRIHNVTRTEVCMKPDNTDNLLSDPHFGLILLDIVNLNLNYTFQNEVAIENEKCLLVNSFLCSWRELVTCFVCKTKMIKVK